MDFLTEMIGRSTINGEEKFYKAYSTAEDITPWLFVDKSDLKAGLEEGYLP